MISRSADGWTWTWHGAEVVAAAESPGQSGRHVEPLAAERAWLIELASLGAESAIELRWIADGRGGLRLFLIAQTAAPTNESEQAAQRAANTLFATPDHALTIPVEGSESLLEVLAPFDLDRAELVEFKRRRVTAPPRRADAGVSYYFAIQPFDHRGEHLTQLMTALSRSPSPVVVSAVLQPVSVPSQLIDLLRSMSLHYLPLTRSMPRESGLHGVREGAEPDPFAVDANSLYAHAARALAGTAFRCALRVAGTPSVPGGVSDALLSAVSGRSRPDGRVYEAPEFHEAGVEMIRPVSDDEARAFADGIRSVSIRRWRDDPWWDAAGAPEPALREVSELVGLDEASALFRLPRPVGGRLPGFPVVEAEHVPLIASGGGVPSVEIGRQILGGRDVGAARVPLRALCRSGLIVGAPSSGTTASALRLVERLWSEHHIPTLLIDASVASGSPYRQVLAATGAQSALAFTVGSDSVAPLRMNPLEVPVGMSIDVHVHGVLDAFDVSIGLDETTRRAVRRAISRLYSEAGRTASHEAQAQESWPAFITLAHELEQAESETAPLSAWIRETAALAGGSVFGGERSTPIEELLDRPVIVELGAFGDEDPRARTFLASLIAHAASCSVEAGGQVDELVHLTVIDDLDSISSSGSPASVVRSADRFSAPVRALLGRRAIGAGILTVTHDPGLVDPAVWRQSDLKVAHRLPVEADRRIVADLLGLTEAHSIRVASLPTAAAYVTWTGLDGAVQVENAADAHAASPTDGDETIDDRIARTAFRRSVVGLPRLAASLVPFAACEGCESPCDHRTTSAELSSTTAMEERFEQSIIDMPYADDPTGWDDWHQSFTAALGAVLSESGADASLDARVCLLLHLARRRWPGADVSVFVKNHRSEAARAAH